jgi:hypothetical protein
MADFMRRSARLVPGACMFLVSVLAMADGTTIDRVYHPYVEPLEQELEWRFLQESEDPVTGRERHQIHRFAFGSAVNDRLFAEVYLLAEGDAEESLAIEGYELEALWQLSEQGEYAVDYGLLFELEREEENDVWEYGTTLLLEKEFGRFSATANLGLFYEWGDGIDNELESALALQTRYRLSPRLEPALELHKGQETFALGPVLVGRERLGIAKALSWEAGILVGLDDDTPDYTIRLLLDYEF